MAHYHLATVVKIGPGDVSSPVEHKDFPNLFKIKTTAQDIPTEEILIYSESGKFDDIQNYIVADFCYFKPYTDELNDVKLLIRCKVLCPLGSFDVKNLKVIGENLYEIPISNIKSSSFGKSGCSPKELVYSTGLELKHKDANPNINYAAMLCFPDYLCSSNAPYFAFCKDIGKVNYAHDDDPFFKSKDNNVVIDIKNRKPFTSHVEVTEYK